MNKNIPLPLKSLYKGFKIAKKDTSIEKPPTLFFLMKRNIPRERD